MKYLVSLFFLVFISYQAWAQPLVNLGKDTIVCDDIILDAQNAGASFTWSTGAITQTIVAQSSAVYYVTVTDATGTSIDSVDVEVKPRPIITNRLADTSLCEGSYKFAPSYQDGYLIWYDSLMNIISVSDTLNYLLSDTTKLYYQAQQVQEKRYTVGEQDLVTNTLYSAKPAQVRGIEFEVFEPITT